MFTYKKDMDDAVYKIKNDGAMFLMLNKLEHHQMMLLGEWCLMMSSQLGNETYANMMIEQSAKWFSLAEKLGIALRRLQGNCAYFIDVIDRENPDVEEIKTSSAQMFLEGQETVEHYPDDFCGALLMMNHKCEEHLNLFENALNHTEDEAMNQFLNTVIHDIKALQQQYKQVLNEMDEDGRRKFCDNYEDERAWALDSGNYFDPKVPEFHNFK